MNKLVSLYIRYGRRYVIKLRENDFIDIVAMWLKAGIVEKKRVFNGKLAEVKKAAKKIIAVEESEERTVYTGNKGENASFKSPDIYIAEIERGYVLGECNGIYVKGKFLHDLIYHDVEERINYCIWRPITKKWRSYITCKVDKNVEKYSTGISLLGFASFNYYHFTVEIIPRLIMCDRIEEYRSLPILVDQIVYDTPQLYEVLKRYNRFQHEIIWVKKESAVFVENIVYPSMRSWMPWDIKSGRPFYKADFMIAESVIQDLRQDLRKTANRRKIFLSRKFDQQHRFLNEEEIITLFKDYGFEVCYPETMNLEEQISIFASAECVAGISGGAFTNIIYAPCNAKIICFLPDDMDFFMYSTIAGIIGQQFTFIDAELVKKNGVYALNQYRVDPVKCQNYLTNILGENR